jgi:hypothetical protein
MQGFTFQELSALSFSIEQKSTSSGKMNIPMIAICLTPRDKGELADKAKTGDEEDPFDERDSDKPFAVPIEFYNGRWSMGWMP